MTFHDKTALVVGGTGGAGNAIARTLAARGERVILTSRDAGRATDAAARLGQGHLGLPLDLTRPDAIVDALSGLGQVDHLVLSAVERDQNTIHRYDIAAAQRAVGLKLVGYATVAAALADRFALAASIVLVGGIAVERPYPGSTSISTINGGVRGLTRTLAVELSPVRVNAVHPGAIADTEAFSKAPKAMLDRILERTPEGRLVETDDIARAVLFLLDAPGVNGVDFLVDGGYHLC
ncbi:KR domain-containing protein [Caulobacter segnis]|uniref:Short-chain dehydrogenase/reductase SDR n=2 Tax=Caulobacter segnis TaxID=88688 RepID=D5VLX2_CAUST|nr:SDR family oxidoreductase [Caulobacter segnis]ADG11495.1 short-chain dehydrogenase/reductase SDR [Caulobacter segnis ATCC 21756]AVQ03154.1 KR domain-containing protein [Caulobacter segnis]